MKSAEQFLAELNAEADLNQPSKSRQGCDNAPLESFEAQAVEAVYADLFRQIEARAVALLARREHGAKELKTKLTSKFRTWSTSDHEVNNGAAPSLDLEAVIADAVAYCQKNNWQSDQRYVEQAVQNYMAKGHGPLKIQQKLQQACDAEEVISAELSLDEEIWVEQARVVLQKKYGECHKPSVLKEQSRRVRFLQSRGFYSGSIWKAFC